MITSSEVQTVRKIRWPGRTIVLLLTLMLAACQGPTPRPPTGTPVVTPAPGVALVLPSPTASNEPVYTVPIPLAPAPTPQTTTAPPSTIMAPPGTPATDGTARVPFWLDQGELTGLAWPEAAQANLQSLRFLVSDGRTFLHDVGQDTDVRIEPPDANRAAWRITYSDRAGRYRLIADAWPATQSDAVIVRAALEAQTGSALDYQVYLYGVPGLANSPDGDVVEVNVSEAVALLSDRQPANGDPAFLAVATDTPWVTASAGYADFNDGLQDLADFRLDQTYESAGPGGNPTLTVWLVPAGEWTMAIGLGADAARARTAVVDALAEAYAADQ